MKAPRTKPDASFNFPAAYGGEVLETCLEVWFGKLVFKLKSRNREFKKWKIDEIGGLDRVSTLSGRTAWVAVEADYDPSSNIEESIRSHLSDNCDDFSNVMWWSSIDFDVSISKKIEDAYNEYLFSKELEKTLKEKT